MNRVTNILDAASFLRKLGEIQREAPLSPELTQELDRFNQEINGLRLVKQVEYVADLIAQEESMEASFPVLKQLLCTSREVMRTMMAPLLEAFHKINEADLPPNLVLRPKQVRFTHKLSEYFKPGTDFKRSGFLKYPTGMGKTILIALMIRALNHHTDASALVLSPRDTINAQNTKKIAAYQEPTVSVKDISDIRPGEKVDCTIATYALGALEAGKIDDEQKLAESYDVIFLDECHRAFGEKMITLLRKKYPNAVFIWLSATPYLGSGLDPKKTRSIFEYVEGEIDSITLKEACEDSDLAPIRAMRVNVKGENLEGSTTDSEMNENLNTDARTDIAINIVKNNIPKDEKGLVFCAGVQHAKDTAEKMQAAGIKAAYVDGTMSSAERDKVLGDLRTGEIQFVCNSDLLIEGFDDDTLKHAIILRTTQSLWIYEQMIGRVCRLNDSDPSKIATIWDVVGQHSGQCTLQGLSRFYGELKDSYLNGEILFGPTELREETQRELEGKPAKMDIGRYAEMDSVIQIEEVAKVTIPRDWLYYCNPQYVGKDLTQFVARHKIDLDQIGFSALEKLEIVPEGGKEETFGAYVKTAVRAYKRMSGEESTPHKMTLKLFELGGIKLLPQIDESYLENVSFIRHDLLKFAEAAKQADPSKLRLRQHGDVHATCICGKRSLVTYIKNIGRFYQREIEDPSGLATILEGLKIKAGFEGIKSIRDFYYEPRYIQAELVKYAAAAGVDLSELSVAQHGNIRVKLENNEEVSFQTYIDRIGRHGRYRIGSSFGSVLDHVLDVIGVKKTRKPLGQETIKVIDPAQEAEKVHFSDLGQVGRDLEAFAMAAGVEPYKLVYGSETRTLTIQSIGEAEISLKEWLEKAKKYYKESDKLDELLAFLLRKSIHERVVNAPTVMTEMDEDYFDEKSNIEKDFLAFSVAGNLPSHLNPSFSPDHLRLRARCQNGEEMSLEDYLNRYAKLTRNTPRLSFNKLKEILTAKGPRR